MILALTTAEKYVGAAYGAVFVVVLVYVLIIALKLARLEREVGALADRVGQRRSVEAEPREEVSIG
jgi:CcmD family protein